MLFGAATRFLACTVVVLILSYVMPGFAAAGFSGAIPAALVTATSGYLAENLFMHRPGPPGRALVGFIAGGSGVYLTQFLVPGMTVPLAGALLTGIAVGAVDLLVSVRSRQ
ncbi:MAG: phage holin family protein [Bacteroidota bacterium]